VGEVVDKSAATPNSPTRVREAFEAKPVGQQVSIQYCRRNAGIAQW